MLEIDLPTHITRALPSAWTEVADITAEAFSEDPVNRWIFGEFKAIRACFRVLARDIYTRRGVCHLIPGKGAAMWIDASEMAALGTATQMALAGGVIRHAGFSAIKRALTAGEIMGRHHPEAPHLYLFTIGVTKAARGQGLGHGLIQPVLEACDRDGKAIYLENSNPDNFGFYSAHGFEHVEHFNAGAGGPPLQAMWRDPR